MRDNESQIAMGPVICHLSPALNFPLAPGEPSALTWVFAGEPLAEIHGLP